MNPDIEKLHTYPFAKLRQLFAELKPNETYSAINLSIGEPKHEPPSITLDALTANLQGVSSYPLTHGLIQLRSAIRDWLIQRFQLNANTVDPEQHIIPVNGTREALFSIAQACIDRRESPVVVMPNPFYQIYEGAALLAGAEPIYANCTADNLWQPDFSHIDDATWQRCQLLYLCTPGNPTGAVMDIKGFQHIIELADRYNFIIVSDECYSELYLDESSAPPSLLQACSAMGRDNYERCLVFHSLSKRSNLPGLRSGFVAGDANIIKYYLNYRTYHGCAMPLPIQMASAVTWQDEQHVRDNRILYRKKFHGVLNILQDALPELQQPDAGFCLWPTLPCSDTDFARQLYQHFHTIVLPGQFLARETTRGNPGLNHIRLALVTSYDECVEAAQRIKTCLENYL